MREDLDEFFQGVNIYRFLQGFLKLPSVDTVNEHFEVLELFALVLLNTLEFFLVFLLLDLKLRLHWGLRRRDHRCWLSGLFDFFP